MIKYFIINVNLVRKENFEFLYIIGRGTYGKVWKARFNFNKKFYAVKEMNKFKIIDSGTIGNIIQERKILTSLNSNLIVNLLCSFQDFRYVYLVLELKNCGDLRYHLINYPDYFKENELKFFFANMMLSLSHIHSKGIVHRDLKPENIIFDKKGYAYITDFGISEYNNKLSKRRVEGTPGYMAPEAIFGAIESYCGDFYSLGVVFFEMIMGKRPYHGKSLEDIKKNMMIKKVMLYKSKKYSDELINFVNYLLVRNPSKRLGAENGLIEIKSHLLFRNFNWKGLESQKIKSDMAQVVLYSKAKVKDVDELFDYEFCNKIEEYGMKTIERYRAISREENFLDTFINYTYINIPILIQTSSKPQDGYHCQHCTLMLNQGDYELKKDEEINEDSEFTEGDNKDLKEEAPYYWKLNKDELKEIKDSFRKKVRERIEDYKENDIERERRKNINEKNSCLDMNRRIKMMRKKNVENFNKEMFKKAEYDFLKSYYTYQLMKHKLFQSSLPKANLSSTKPTKKMVLEAPKKSKWASKNLRLPNIFKNNVIKKASVLKERLENGYLRKNKSAEFIGIESLKRQIEDKEKKKKRNLKCRSKIRPRVKLEKDGVREKNGGENKAGGEGRELGEEEKLEKKEEKDVKENVKEEEKENENDKIEGGDVIKGNENDRKG